MSNNFVCRKGGVAKKTNPSLGGSEDRRVFRGRRLAELLKDDFWRARLFY